MSGLIWITFMKQGCFTYGLSSISWIDAAYAQLEKVRHGHDRRFDIQILSTVVHVSAAIRNDGPIALKLLYRRDLVWCHRFD